MDIAQIIKNQQSLQDQFRGITMIALDLLTAKSYASLVHIRGTSTPGWMLKMQYILQFQRAHKDALDQQSLYNDDMSAFIESINYAHEALSAPDMSGEIKATLHWLYRTQIRSIFLNKRMKARLFCRRNEMHKDNPFRTFFVVDYINEEVFALLHNEEMSYKNIFEAQAVAVPDNIAELESSQLEYEKCFDVLCKAYGEEELKDKKHFNSYIPQDLPEKLRRALKSYYDALWSSIDKNKKTRVKKSLPLNSFINSKKLAR